MIYLIDNGFRIKSALNILVNQVESPEGFKKCQCLCCKAKSNSNKNNDLRSHFANNDNQGTCLARPRAELVRR